MVESAVNVCFLRNSLRQTAIDSNFYWFAERFSYNGCQNALSFSLAFSILSIKTKSYTVLLNCSLVLLLTCNSKDNQDAWGYELLYERYVTFITWSIGKCDYEHNCSIVLAALK